MIKRLSILAVIIQFLICSCGDSNKPELNRGLKIITLSPSITETVATLGHQKSLVGVSDYCDFPQSVKSLPKCGGLINTNLEKVLSLSPDHVIVSEAHLKYLEKLKEFDCSLISVKHDSIEDILESITKISAILNCSTKGEELRKSLENELNELSKDKEAFSKTKVLMVLNQPHDKAISQAYVCGEKTYYHEMLSILGAQNIAKTTGYKILNAEQIIALKPELIIIQAALSKQEDIPAIKASWKPLLEAAGLKKENLKILRGQHATRPGPRFPLTMTAIKKLIKQHLNEKIIDTRVDLRQ